MLDLFDFCRYAFELLVEFVNVQLVDAAYRLLGQLQHVFTGNAPFQFHNKGREGLFYGHQHLVPGVVFLFKFLIDLFFKEDLFQRSKMPFLFQFPKLDLQLQFQQVFGMIGRGSQEFVHAHEPGLVIFDHTSIGRNTDFAVGKGVEGICRNIRRNARGQFHLDLYFSRRIVPHLLDLDLALIVGLQDGINQLGGGHVIRNILDEQGFLVTLFNPAADPYFPSPLAFVIIGDVNHARRQEIRI